MQSPYHHSSLESSIPTAICLLLSYLKSSMIWCIKTTESFFSIATSALHMAWPPDREFPKSEPLNWYYLTFGGRHRLQQSGREPGRSQSIPLQCLGKALTFRCDWDEDRLDLHTLHSQPLKKLHTKQGTAWTSFSPVSADLFPCHAAIFTVFRGLWTGGSYKSTLALQDSTSYLEIHVLFP